MQNSTQPIGARVLSPTAMNAPRSLAAAIEAAHTKASAVPAVSIRLNFLPMFGPFPSCWGHNSQKAFAPRLNDESHFEEKASKGRD
jgi:hypothetical protein